MKHILIIEDEPLIRDEIVILLEKAGYQVGKITDFKETTKQVQRLSLIHISEPTRQCCTSRMPSSA